MPFAVGGDAARTSAGSRRAGWRMRPCGYRTRRCDGRFSDMTGTAWTLGEIVRRQAQLRPEATALVDGERRLGYRELDRESDRIAQALRRDGVGAGARVGLFAHDSARSFAIVFGIAKVGAVTVGVNWRLGVDEIAFQLEDAGAVAWFVGGAFAGTAGQVAARCPALRLGVAIDGPPADPATGLLPFAAWLGDAPATPPDTVVEREHVAVQLYTAGTTGKPKGVMLAHRSFVAVVESMRAAGDAWIGFGPDDVSLLAIPSFHIGGMWWAMTGLNAGATNVVLPMFAGWRVLRAIAEHRVTRTCLVPAMLQVCLSEPECARTDLSSLRTIVYGGSPIPRANLAAAMRTFGCDFAQIYGLTETGNTAVCLRPEDHRREELFEAAGRPYPGVQVRIAGAHGEALPPGAIGEICIRSPANMLGYWNRPEATAATLRDGFVHTGDAGFVDGGGYLHICDRLKDMICSAGENLYPAEIEAVLCAHPAVAEAAVIGVPDDRWGELAIAIVVVRPGRAADPAPLLAHVRRHLADFKVPRRIEFAGSLPRTPSGKIQKFRLRELARGLRPMRAAPGEGSTQ